MTDVEAAAPAATVEVAAAPAATVEVAAASMEEAKPDKQQPLAAEPAAAATATASSPSPSCSLPDPDDYLTPNVDEAVRDTLAKAKEWAALPVSTKMDLCRECLELVKKHRQLFLDVALARRGYKKEVIGPEAFEYEKTSQSLLGSVHTMLLLSGYIDTFRRMTKTSTTTAAATPSTKQKKTTDTTADTSQPGESQTATAAASSFPSDFHVLGESADFVRVGLIPAEGVVNSLLAGEVTTEMYLQKVPSKENTDSSGSGGGGGGGEASSAVVQNAYVRALRGDGYPMYLLDKSTDVDSTALQLNPEEYYRLSGGVAAVLGAGNFDGAMDLLTALLLENKTVVYAFAAISKQLAPAYALILEPFITPGYLRLIAGGPIVGEQLIHHPSISRVVMTGAIRTANVILFGKDNPAPPKQTDSDQEILDALKLKIPITFELGNITPCIIAPTTDWTEKELRTHARHVVNYAAANGGHLCGKLQIVITSSHWSQRRRFNDYVRHYMQTAKMGGMFYPGAQKVFDGFVEKLRKEGANLDDSATEIAQGRLFVEGISQTSCLLTEEVFCPILGEVALDCPLEEYLEKAVDFANNQIHGTLAITLVAKPGPLVTTAVGTDGGKKRETVLLKPKEVEEKIQDAIDRLKYGSVGVNINAVINCTNANLIWGGYSPAVRVDDLQSGFGVLQNAWGFRRPLKSVVKSPFFNSTLVIHCVPEEGVKESERSLLLIERLVTAMVHQAQPSPSIISAGLDILKLGSAVWLGI